jgi:hypothetical protein
MLKKTPSKKFENVITEMLRPMFTPSRLKINIAKKKPPPIMPGANADEHSHNIITIKLLYQVRCESVNIRMRIIYANSRINTLTKAIAIQKDDVQLHEILLKASLSKLRQIIKAATDKPMPTGNKNFVVLNCFNTEASSVCIEICFGAAYPKVIVALTNHQ